jgi:crotonobetainyl-CoA:carnitine CoA-transferase CaiB-like acyl-CoA transferase
MPNLPLQGITIIDFSHRLPGPFCGKILSDLGADVIKIEDHIFKDPFLAGLFAEFDPSFIAWYENLNNSKKVLRFDFNSPEDQKKIAELVQKSDALIMGLPQSTRQKLKLTDQDLAFNKPFVVIELLASRTEKKSMHDLNALATSGLLSLFIGNQNKKIIDPPFLPIAGIAFGHKAATDLLANLLCAQKKMQTIFTKTYLDEVTNNLLGIFWPKVDRDLNRKLFLHNGQYPCYSIYQTKDHKYVALAAVEEKFWKKFCEVFEIKTTLDRFYNKDQELFLLISNSISSKNRSEIEDLIANEDLCLSSIV